MANSGIKNSSFADSIGVDDRMIVYRIIRGVAAAIKIAQHLNVFRFARITFPEIPFIVQYPLRPNMIDKRVGNVFDHDGCARNAIAVVNKFTTTQNRIRIPIPTVFGIGCRVGANIAATIFNVGFEGRFLCIGKYITGGIHKYDGGIVRQVCRRK